MEERMNKLCRICFEEPQGHLQDFEPYEQLVENIIQCKPISDPILNLNQICDSCAADLIAADHLRTKCLESDALIRQILNREDDNGTRPDQIPAQQAQAKKVQKTIGPICDHCADPYDPSTTSELLDLIATTVNFQFVALDSPSSRTCETCLAKYMIASELIDRLRTVKFAPHPPKTCFVCGSCANLCLVDRNIRHLAMKLDPNSSMDLDQWKKICRGCAADFVSAKELLDKKKATTRVETPASDDEVDHFDQDTQAMSEDENFVLKEEEEESIEGKPLNERLRGDDFEWPLTKEDIMPNPKLCRLPRFSCDVCFCVLEGNEEKEIHEEAGHDKENRCKYCQVKCNSSGELRRHILKHLPHLWNWTCEICAKNFYYKENFFFHHKHHYADQYKFKCDLCPKAYTRKMALRNHLKMRHLKERRYACSYCPKTYIDCVDLKRHLPIHTGIYPFQCSICPKGFVRKKLLQEHLMTH